MDACFSVNNLPSLRTLPVLLVYITSGFALSYCSLFYLFAVVCSFLNGTEGGKDVRGGGGGERSGWRKNYGGIIDKE